ncbi:MAG: LLM class flavin-dependent oxidoreductase [Actinobacteria bacterium]|nr:LLM class flavin-dependent oxidoreductase [Actinomycetota bacterium]
MKIRIGFGFGGSAHPDDTDLFGRLVDDLESLGFDSLWVSERANGLTLDPIVAMSYAAGRTERLKFGPAVMVLPGRNPVLCAKAIASLDLVSGGRALPAFGLGIADAAEHQAFGVARGDRAAWFDEALPLMRRLWDASEEVVDHQGPRFTLSGVQLQPKPVQQPIDVWLGGFAPSELRRCARLGDGWLPSFTTPAAVSEGIATINSEASTHGRSIDQGHFGALVPFVHRALPDRFVARLRDRQPDLDPAEIVATGVTGLADRLASFVDAGASKFVLFPLDEPDDWQHTINAVADECLPLQT